MSDDMANGVALVGACCIIFGATAYFGVAIGAICFGVFCIIVAVGSVKTNSDRRRIENLSRKHEREW